MDITNAGDIAVFTYSGHGTQVVDRNSDESDPYDEAIFLYDDTVIDDELRGILQGLHPQATLVVISDSAMTALALRVIKQNPDVTYREFYAGLHALLPSEDYPQTPQLEGSDANKDRKLFEPLTVEPAPAPESPGCLMGVMQQVKRFFNG